MTLNAASLQVQIGATDDATPKLTALGSTINKLGGGAGKIAAGMATGFASAGVALAGGLGLAINSAANFESVMSQVGAVSGSVGAEFDDLRQLAIDMGAATSFSASEAAQAMAELAKGGISTSDILGGALEGTLALAAAGGLGLADAATIAADSLNIFGLSGSEMARVADTLASAANASSVDVSDLAQSMAYVGPVAASVGYSIEETTAAIAALGVNGLKGSEAGTGLRTMLLSLAAPTKKSAALMEDLGLSFFDSAGEMLGLQGIADELAGTLGTMSEQQRIATLETLFGREGMSAALAVMKESNGGMTEWVEKVSQQGAAGEMAAKMLDNFKGSLDAFKGSLETAGIVLGSLFLPLARGVVDWATAGVSAMVPLIQAWGPRLIGALQSAGAALQAFGGYIGSAVGAVVGAFNALRNGEITVAQFVGGLKILFGQILTDLGLIASGAGAALSGFGGAIAGALGAAIPVIQAALGIIGQEFGAWVTRTALPFLATNLPLWLSALGNWLTGTALPAIGGFVAGIGTAFGSWITGTAIPYLQTNLPQWLAAIGAWISGTAIPAIGGFLGTVGAAFGSWVNDTAIPALQANLPGWIDAITGWISGTALPAITSSVEQLASALASWIRGEESSSALGEWLGVITQGLADGLGLLGEFVGIAAPRLAEWIKSEETQARFGELAAAVGNGLADILNALNDFSINAGQRLNEWLKAQDWQAIWDQFVQIADAACLEMAASIESFSDSVGATIKTAIWDAVTTWVLGWGDFNNATNTGIGDALATLRAFPSQAAAALGNMGSVLYQAGVDLVMGLARGILGAMPQAVGAAQALAGAVAGALGGALQIKSPSRVTMAMGREVVNGLVAGMDEKEQDAAKKAADVASSIAKAITDTIGASRALAGFRATDLPSGEQLGWVRHLTESMVATMQDAAKHFDEKGLKAATEFSDAAGKVGSSVKNAVEGLLALGKADWAASSPTGSAMGWFTHLIASLVTNFARAGETFEGESLKTAGEFADAAGKVGGSVKNAVEGLKELAGANWADSSPDGSAMGWFTHLIASLVQNFATAAKSFEDGALGAAGDFGDAANKVMGTIGPALDGLKKLASGFATPTNQAVDALMTAIRYVIGKFAAMAAEMDGPGVKAMAEFASATGTALGAAKTGVELFAAMAGDKDKAGNNQPVGIPSAKAIDDLMHGIRYVIARFREMAQSMENEGIAQMQTFASAAGQVLAAAKSGTDLFKSMETLAVPAKAAIDYLLGSIGYVITQTRAIATGIGTQGLAEAQAFASGALDVANTIKAALDLFPKLAEYKDLPTKALNAIFVALEGALIEAANNTARADALKEEANEFLKNMQDAQRAYTQAMAISNGMGSMPATPATNGGALDFGSGVKLTLPGLAEGGIVTKPTLVAAGERGAEAIIPLKDYQGGGRNISIGDIHIHGNISSEIELEDAIVRGIEQARRRGRLDF